MAVSTVDDAGAISRYSRACDLNVLCFVRSPLPLGVALFYLSANHSRVECGILSVLRAVVLSAWVSFLASRESAILLVRNGQLSFPQRAWLKLSVRWLVELVWSGAHCVI